MSRKKSSLYFLAVAFLLAIATSQTKAIARGFGGFRGGGFGGGGFGGFRGGGGFGGFHNAGRFGGEAFRGGFGGADFTRDGFGGAGQFGRSEAGNYAGIGQRETSGYRGGDAAGWGRGGVGGGNWGNDAGRWGGSVNRGRLNNFLGLPTDGGLDAARGTVANHSFTAQSLSVSGTHPYSATWAHAHGQNVQSWAADHPQLTSVWNSNHPWAWTPAGVGAAAWAATAWAGAAWPAVGNWLGWSNPAYYQYDYGENITYDGDNVYYNSQPAGTVEQYYQEAGNLAATAPAAASDGNDQWMPLGVFGLVEGDSKTPSRTFELAVNKQGTIRGNSADPYSNVLPLHGAIDRKTQRVCWTVGTNTATVYDTGLYNLTKNESPILVHSGPKATEQEMLVRLNKPPAPSGNASPGSTK